MDTINVTSCLQRICLSTDNKLLLVINFAKQILSKTKLILALNNNYQKKKNSHSTSTGATAKMVNTINK